MSFWEKLQGTTGQSLIVGGISGLSTLAFNKLEDFIYVGQLKVPVPVFIAIVAAAGNIGSDTISGLVKNIPYVGPGLGTGIDYVAVPTAVVASLILTNPSVVTDNPKELFKFGAIALTGNMVANWLMPTNLANTADVTGNDL